GGGGGGGARVGLLGVGFRGGVRGTGRLLRALRLLVQHRQGHGVPPDLARYIAAFMRVEMARSGESRVTGKRRALVIGGSMSGLLAGGLLPARRLGSGGFGLGPRELGLRVRR